MHGISAYGGSSATPTRSEGHYTFTGPDRENDCRNKILALKREANRYGRVVESHEVTRRGEQVILDVVHEDAPKHRPGRKFRTRG